MQISMNKYIFSFFILLFFVLGQPVKALSPETKTAVTSNQVVVIGASYAKGWLPTELAGFKVINKGVGGEETHQILARFQTDVVDLKPKPVIIWGFINDIFRSKPDLINAKLEKTKQNILTMIKMAQDAGITPILATEVTITTRTGFIESLASFVGELRGKSSYQDYINGLVVETNHWLTEVATKQDIVLLDFKTVLADETGKRKREYATDDGSHLTVAAYMALTDYVKTINLRL